MTDAKLLEAMTRRFGSFGTACYRLCLYRSDTNAVSDNQIEEAFEHFAGEHRKCFNKKAYIASCRLPD